MDLIAIIGTLAAICSSVSFAPQAWKIARTGETEDISAASFAFTVAAFALWIVYGASRGDWPLLINGTICLLLSGFILVMTLVPKSWRKRVKRAAS